MAGAAGRRGVVGVLLAGGRGERFGGDKLLAPLPGCASTGSELVLPGAPGNAGTSFDPGCAGMGSELVLPGAPGNAGTSSDPILPVGVAACRNLIAAVPDVIAVVRPGDAVLAAALSAAGARVIECPRADDGMGASLACGVQAASDADGWIVALADMPWIRPETIARVAAAIKAGAIVAAPFHAGERGHPVGFARPCGAALSALRGDEGARSVIAAHRDAFVRIGVDDPGVLRDVDTPRDLQG
jgi:molybdenum cofactor cytidylyltransferase